MPGDDIVGFVTRGAGVSVHRADCGNVAGLRRQPERMVEVEWEPGPGAVFMVQIQVEAIDRSRLLSDVTRVLSDNHVNILSATVSTSRDRVAISRFVFEMAETTHLNTVLAAVRKVDGVYDVYRITGATRKHGRTAGATSHGPSPRHSLRAAALSASPRRPAPPARATRGGRPARWSPP